MPLLKESEKRTGVEVSRLRHQPGVFPSLPDSKGKFLTLNLNHDPTCILVKLEPYSFLGLDIR